MNMFYRTAFALFAAVVSADSQILSVQAQSAISPSGVTAAPPTGGGTENLSVTNGSRTSLSVGNSTSFGASTNLSLSSGLVGVGRSVLVPATATVSSSIGTTGTTNGITKINISNLTAKGGGTVNPSAQGGIGSGTTINSTEGQFASGDATIDGMNATVNMSIGKTTTDSASQASFFAIVNPNMKPDDTNKACSPTVDVACNYLPQDALVSGNAAASANLSTQTNIDIQANSFTQTFAQSF
jgi:hypothetical protein